MTDYKASRTEFTIAGLTTHVYGLEDLSSTPRELSVLFFLHGRLGYALEPRYEAPVHEILKAHADAKDEGRVQRDLVIVTFDQRNHGHRKIHDLPNLTWTEGNALHAQDMFSAQYGTATDVSLLIRFLPSYLFPNDEMRVHEWMCAGISLGGHATWIVLEHEKRVKTGVVIIGCPDYEKLMKHRTGTSNLPFSAPHIPKSLLETLKELDPAAMKDGLVRLHGKSVCVLSGGADQLVPWDCSDEFVGKVRRDPGIEKYIKVYEGVGHEVTPEMVRETAEFVIKSIGGSLSSSQL